MCAILKRQKPYCNQMPKAEKITSPANPLLKGCTAGDRARRADSDGLLRGGDFHLLEEALRSDCDVAMVLASESVARPWKRSARLRA